MGVGQCLLVGGFGHGMAFDAHAQAGMAHHGEHIKQAASGFADEVAFGFVELHHAGGAGVDAHFVFDGGGGHAVSPADAAVGLDFVFGHDKQRKAFDAGGGTGQAGEHEVDNVFGQFVFAPGDEGFLAADAVAAVFLRHGFGGHLGQVGAGLRLGEVHGAAPEALAHFRQEGLLLLFGAVFGNGFHRAHGEHGQQREGEVAAVVHFFARGGNHRRQALAAVFRRGAQAGPAGFAEGLVGGGEVGMGDDFAVFQARAVQIAGAAGGQKDFFAELGRFFDDGGGGVFVQAAFGIPLGDFGQVAVGLQGE